MMNAVFLNLNDTIAMSESAVVELAKALNTCQPCMHEAETSCNDVKIVALICVAIVAVAIVASWTITSWQKAVLDSMKKERDDKKGRDKEESNRKQTSDLRDKLLTFLSSATLKEDYNKEKDKVIKTQKDINSVECRYYIKVLSAMIDGKPIPSIEVPKEDPSQGASFQGASSTDSSSKDEKGR